MNLMGKIFTLLIFFLSIAFLVVAVMVGASHRNWKQAAQDAKQRADFSQLQLDAAKSKATEKDKQLEREKVARTSRIAQLEVQRNLAQQARDTAQDQLRDELVISQQRLEALKSAETRLAELDQQVAQLKAENSKLVENVAAQQVEVVNKTNDLYRIKGEKGQLETMVRDLTAQVTQRTKVMNAHGLNENSLVDHIEPKVDGVVKAVSGNVVVVSLGSDDGLRNGHIVDIFRRQRFVGKAKILTAESDQASARVMPEYLRSKVQEGDHVTTKL